ncbi:lipopolysaccharide biosynthesis protein [Chitinivibrio alkaliphilus]|uniref:MATE like superfamily protein n=1 Tax=Chitinivibrio alkaliphilus ACht1 TaxID=1313304 RepID=U7D6V1_9BACT|nr:lipopolysaccharide biosynthesis protein [Chitinivibrio alkaliphilus]ERP30807.1 MATE like superfamily protein [Chitinivibrio alkaliphilus ACht1]
MKDTLRQRTITALIWSSAERFGQQGIRFFVTLILARLLTPEDYGLMGLILVFIHVTEAFINQGFGQAIIQKKDVSENDLTTAFTLSGAMAALLYAALFFGAPAIAAFYERPELIPLTKFVGLVVLLDALVIIQRVQFEKALDFKNISLAAVSASLMSSGVGLFLAFSGAGVWALAGMMVAQKTVLAGMLWIQSSWIPRGRVSRESFIDLFSFGWKLQVSGMLHASFKNLHALIIGRFFAVDIVGYYTKAKSLKDLPMKNLSRIVGKVTFPAFSAINDDLPRVKRGYTQSMQLLTLVCFPLMCILLATAENLIPFLLGEQWYTSIPFFQLLCLVGMLYPLHASNVNILKVVGRTDLFLKLEIAKKILNLTAILISIRWGVYALVIGQVVTSYIALFLNAGIAGPLIKYPMHEQIRDVFPYFLCATAAALTAYGVDAFVPLSSYGLSLLLQLCSGGAVYISLVQLWNLPAWETARNIGKERRKKSTP